MQEILSRIHRVSRDGGFDPCLQTADLSIYGRDPIFPLGHLPSIGDGALAESNSLKFFRALHALYHVSILVAGEELLGRRRRLGE